MKLYRLLSLSLLGTMLASCSMTPKASSSNPASSSSSSSLPSFSEPTVSSSEEPLVGGDYVFDASGEEAGDDTSILTATDALGASIRLKTIYSSSSFFSSNRWRVFYNLDPIDGVSEYEFSLGESDESVQCAWVTSDNPLDETCLNGGFADTQVCYRTIGSGRGIIPGSEVLGLSDHAYFCCYTQESRERDTRAMNWNYLRFRSADVDVADPDGEPYAIENETWDEMADLLYGCDLPMLETSGIHELNAYGAGPSYANLKAYRYRFSYAEFSKTMAEYGFAPTTIEGMPENSYAWYHDDGAPGRRHQVLQARILTNYHFFQDVEFKMAMEVVRTSGPEWPSDSILDIAGRDVGNTLVEPEIEFSGTGYFFASYENGRFTITRPWKLSDKSDDEKKAIYAQGLADYVTKLEGHGYRADPIETTDDIKYLYHPELGIHMTVCVDSSSNFSLTSQFVTFADSFPGQEIIDTVDPYIASMDLPLPGNELGSSYYVSSYKAEEAYGRDVYPNASAYLRIFNTSASAFASYKALFEGVASLTGDPWAPAYFTFYNPSDLGVSAIKVEAGLDNSILGARGFYEALESTMWHSGFSEDAASALANLFLEKMPSLCQEEDNAVDVNELDRGIYVRGYTFSELCEGIEATRDASGYHMTIVDAEGGLSPISFEGWDTISGCFFDFHPKAE